MSNKSYVEELEHQSKLADAKLGVAEELGWIIAAFAAIAAYLKWESWLVTAAVAVGMYLITTYRYRKRATIAEDQFFHVAGLGKYFVRQPNTED